MRRPALLPILHPFDGALHGKVLTSRAVDWTHVEMTDEMTDDRRDTHRLRLDKPILGRIGNQGALLLDLGAGGVLLEHYGTFERGATFELTFPGPAGEVAYVCVVAHSKVVRTASDGSQVSHTGASLEEPIGDSARRLQELMASFVVRILAAQRANAQGAPMLGDTLLDLGGARRSRAHGYLRYTFIDGVWSSEPSASPKQPPDGFTVGAQEDEEEIRLLCEAYTAANVEGRALIRVLAEMSARAARVPI